VVFANATHEEFTRSNTESYGHTEAGAALVYRRKENAEKLAKKN